MASSNQTRFAILGVLTMHASMTGYDIRKYIESSIAYFWHENYGHLYPMLKELLRDGLIALDPSPSVPTSARTRIAYCITPAGRVALQTWLQEPLEPKRSRNELLFKTWFGDQMPVAVTRSRLQATMDERQQEIIVLEGFLKENDERIVRLQAAGKQPRQVLFQRMTILNGIRGKQATVEWCRECLAMLEQFPE